MISHVLIVCIFLHWEEFENLQESVDIPQTNWPDWLVVPGELLGSGDGLDESEFEW